MESKLLGQLKEQLNAKQYKIKQILDITVQQVGLIKNEDLESFADSLVQRQSLMEEVDRINDEISLIEKQVLEAVDEKAIMDRTVINLRVEIQNLIKQIITLDEENNTKFKQDFDTVRQKLKELKGNKAVIQQAYYPKRQQQSFGYFIDSKK